VGSLGAPASCRSVDLRVTSLGTSARVSPERILFTSYSTPQATRSAAQCYLSALLAMSAAGVVLSEAQVLGLRVPACEIRRLRPDPMLREPPAGSCES